MKEEDKRAVALNSLTSIGKEFVTLSDSTTIGKDVLKDLKKLMELELREKYKVNKTKWKVITIPKYNTSSEPEGVGVGTTEKPSLKLSKVYHVINDDVDLKLVDKLKENNKKIKEKENELNELNDNDKTDTDKYKRVEKEIKELKKFFVIDMVTDTPIYFNTIVNVGDEDIPVYYVPYIELNKDPKEIATILNDKKELDKIFREKQFKSFDDMVILDFYNEITKKLSDTKDYLRKTDPDIRQDIIDDLYNKLFALYDIKEYYLKDRIKDKEEIKEKFIKDKIKKNNNLSIGGEVLDVTRKFLKITEKKPQDSAGKKVVKSLGKVASPVVAAAELAVKDIPIATFKGVVKGVNKTGIGLYKGVRATSKATEKIIDAPSKVIEFVVNKAQERQKKNKENAEKFLEADKFLHIVTDSLKNKTKNVIDKELEIGLLKDLSASLNEESIYKKSIEDLIDIHDSISGINRDNLLEQEEEDAKEYIGKKKEASGDFILKAIDKYKNLKKSFVDKVNKDKDAVEKMLEEGVGDTFEIDITFGKIINSNNETYIKKLKNMNSFLYLLNNNKKKGGAAPIYDSKKIKKDEGEQELSGNTPLYYYKKLNDNYSEIVNLYYKLVDDINGEECHTINKNANTAEVKKTNANPILDNAVKEAEEAVKEVDKCTPVKIAECEKKGKKCNPSSGRYVKDDKPVVKEYKVEDKPATNEDKVEDKPAVNKDKVEDKPAVNEDKVDDKPATNEDKVDDKPAVKEDKVEDKPAVNKDKVEEDDKKDIDETGENRLNVLNEKIQLIENRIKLLNEIILKLPKELEKLYKIIKNIKGLPQATEYEDYIINILKEHKIELFEKDKDKHPIIKTLNNEKNEKEVELKKTKSMREEAKKAIEDKNAIKKANLLREFPRNIHAGGGDDDDVKDLKKDLKLYNKQLINKYIKLYNIIDYKKNNNNDKNLHHFIIELKNDVEYLENNNDAKKGSDKSVEVSNDKGIYEDIWYDYNLAVNKTNNKQDKWKNYLSYLTEGEKVYDRVIQNNLDPEIVLKINFRDKSIYIFLMFLIRTINIIALEFLIEYNLIKTLQYTIMLYGFMYLFIILLLVILVNYDSYKLRILFNYLNIHINSSNLLLQNVLFIIFIILVYILVKSDDFLKYFGDLFDFTNIYNNIYKFNESLNENSDINLTQNEKLKLLYRIDIISMIIFIFSAFLVLIL